MLLLTLFTPLLHPLREQISLLRALASGGHISGAKLILMPVSTSSNRFGVMEHFMMALAGGWLLLRVILCGLVDEDKMPLTNRKSYKQSMGKQLDDMDNLPTEFSTLEEYEYEREMLFQSEEEIIYWGCENSNDGKEPIIRFSPLQLNILLCIEDDSDEYEYEDDDESQNEQKTTQGIEREEQRPVEETVSQEQEVVTQHMGYPTEAIYQHKENEHSEKIVLAD